MMDIASIGFDALKVMGGMGASAITFFTVKGMIPPKANGHAKCDEHAKLMTLTVETNTLVKEMNEDSKEERKETREDRTKLFDICDDLKEEINDIKVNMSYSKGKQSIKKKPSKELSPFQCLVIDDMVADATCKTLESYLQNIIVCTPVTSVKEALDALKEQTYDICFIDYFLNTSETGGDVYKFFKKAYPDMKCLVFSGQHPDMISPEIADVYIPKPFTRKEVIEKINRLVGEDL
jgi:CheY-like chemotaxis protein